jgi:hypothetical protein
VKQSKNNSHHDHVSVVPKIESAFKEANGESDRFVQYFESALELKW